MATKNERKNFNYAAPLPAPIEKLTTFAISAKELYLSLGGSRKRFRTWWLDAANRQNLSLNTDFVISASTDKETDDDFLMTARSARLVAASDESEKGRSYLTTLINLANAIQSGDPDVIELMLSKIDDPFQLRLIAQHSEERAWFIWRRHGKSPAWFRQWWRIHADSSVETKKFIDTLRARGVGQEGILRCAEAICDSIADDSDSPSDNENGTSKGKKTTSTREETEQLAVQFAEYFSALEIEHGNITGEDSCIHVCRTVARKVRATLPI